MARSSASLRLVALMGFATLAAPAAGEPADRITARTSARMLEQALSRARAGGEGALAGLAIAATLADSVPAGEARRGLAALGHSSGEVAEQARWIAAALDPDPQARPAGLVRNLAVLGPFRDLGGGLTRREGPELPGQVWGDRRAAYDWGAHEVRWRPVPAAVVSARGVPLDLLIHPRRESCSYLATRVRLPAAQALLVQVAAAGSVRLIWNGADAARSEDSHSGLLFDRVAARVDAERGDHHLAVKVCSGPIDDRGRVRIRVQDPAGRPIDLATSADLAPTRSGAPGLAAARAAALPTALDKALAPGPAPSPERALAMALVRRLGEADDQRSPRAPGLLDSVATAEGIAPDRLAAAGWAAPFGPQRSGWLGLARQRAQAARDPETASFCLRMLAQARTRGGFADWALATLGEPPTGDEGDLEVRLIRAAARASLGQESIRRAALAELVELARGEGERAPITLWAHLAWLARDLDPKIHLRATDAIAAGQPERRDRDWIEARTRVGQAAVQKGAEAALASGSALQDADTLLAFGEALERAGLRAEAADLYRLGSELAPNREGFFVGLARARYQQHDRAGGDRALARARALDPNNARTRAEASLRGQVPSRPTPAATSPLLVEPAVFLARKARAPARKGEVEGRLLHRLYAESLLANRRVSRLFHVAYEVVVEPRTQAELLNSYGLAGTPEILRAVVHRAGGGVEPALEQRIDRGQARLRWRELKAGDVTEVAIRSFTERPVGQRGDFPHQGFYPSGTTLSEPTLYTEVVLEFPEDAPLAHDVVHGKPDRLLEDRKGGRRTVRFIWDQPRNMADEPMAPAATEVLPTVVWSLYPGWDDFVGWFRDATAGFTEPDEQVRRLARELTAGLTGRDDKVRALFGYVADRVRYVNYESAERWLPNRPQQVLARRQGDCDDKSTLLISLLKACDIEASLVFVQPRDTHRFPSLLSAPKAALPYFGHAISILPGEKGEPPLWLNPTSPHSRVGRLHSNEAGVPAVIVTATGAVRTTTPAASPDDHGRDARWIITLDASGAGELQADERHRGDSAFWLRRKLGEVETRAQTVESEVLARWWRSVGVDGKVDFDPNPGDGDARLAYRARSDAFAQREGKALAFPLSPAATLTSRLAPLTRRTLPVVLPVQAAEGGAPNRDTREIEVHGPPGFRLAALPRSGSEPGGAFGEARLEHTRKSDRVLLVRRTLIFRADTVPPEKYAEWRSWLQRVDSLMHQSVRFVPVRAGVPTVAGK